MKKKREPRRQERRRAVLEMNLLSEEEGGDDGIRGLLRRRRAGCLPPFAGLLALATVSRVLTRASGDSRSGAQGASD